MKIQGLIFVSMLALVACNRAGKEEVEKIKSLAKQDSLKAVQASQKDSLITSYLNDLDEVQENLDRIKQREKIITMQSVEMGSGDKESVVAEIKELDDWIVSNDRKMNNLQAKVKSLNATKSTLENLVAHLTQQTAEQDEEIADLQGKLGKADDSLRHITAQFNDSIVVIQKQRMDISALNTVYYITGTMKELQDKGVIDKQGGLVGMGRVAELSNSVNNAAFTSVNLLSLKGVNLHGKFRRFVTVHPEKAYEIYTNGKSDSLMINMPSTFWSESKYLVIATK
jgi:hypothetical protein